MKKIGFVIPWYSEKIPGGAEMELRGLTTHLHESGVEIEILTTCVKEFASNWNVNHFKSGAEIIHGFTVRRFKVRKRNTAAFNEVNYKLMNGIPITAEEEKTYISESVSSPDMYRYMKEHSDDYSLFVFIPYMFGTTYYGMQVCPEKTVMIPCFHDEPYVYMNVYKPVFENIAGIIYHAKPEYDLANKVFDLKNVSQAVLGEGVYTELEAFPDDFRKKFGIDGDFIIYAGRKDKGKNVHVLVRYFEEYLKRHDVDLKLVLIGGGEIEIPSELVNDGKIVDLGFVDVQDKYNAEAAALLLCQPSLFESFSLVIMESWLCSRPVMVSGRCDVTRHFVSDSNGGLYFNNYPEFEGCLEYMLANRDVMNAMGKNGRDFVLSKFSWNVIVEIYMKFFKEIADKA